jgi:hypothetical protein
LRVMEIPVRMRQTRMRPVRWESPPGFKCQTLSTRRTEIIRSSRRELSNGNNLNPDSGGSAACGLGRNIFLFGTKEAAQNMRRRRQRRGRQSRRAPRLCEPLIGQAATCSIGASPTWGSPRPMRRARSTGVLGTYLRWARRPSRLSTGTALFEIVALRLLRRNRVCRSNFAPPRQTGTIPWTAANGLAHDAFAKAVQYCAGLVIRRLGGT